MYSEQQAQSITRQRSPSHDDQSVAHLRNEPREGSRDESMTEINTIATWWSDSLRARGAGTRIVMILLLLIALSLGGVPSAWGSRPAYFGFAVGDLVAPKPGFTFPGRYERGKFVSILAMPQALQGFRAGHTFPGITDQGQSVRVRVLGAPSLASGEPFTVDLAFREPVRPTGSTLLFWTPEIQVEYRKTTKIDLDSAVVTALNKRAFALIRRAQPRNVFGSSGVRAVRLGKPVVRRIQGEADVVAVVLPVLFRGRYPYPLRRDGLDDRGSVFLIYSLSSRRVIYEAFGHPEWGPEAADVLQVRPLLFFRIVGDPRTYFLSEWHGPWESIRYAILDLPTGKPLLVHAR